MSDRIHFRTAVGMTVYRCFLIHSIHYIGIQLNIVAFPTYAEKFTRNYAFEPFLLLSVVIVTLPN